MISFQKVLQATQPLAPAGPSLQPHAPEKKKPSSARAKGRRAAFVLGGSALFLALYSMLFFYPQMSAYLKASSRLRQMEAEIGDYQTSILPTLEKEMQLHQAAYQEQYSQTTQGMNRVFPEGVNKRDIVEIFESFAGRADVLYAPFAFNSISFQPSVQQLGYVVTPVSMTIRSSTLGFQKFLDLVDFSGDPTQTDPIRLMSISSIQIKYNGLDGKTGKDNGVTFTVKLNVYSRPSPS